MNSGIYEIVNLVNGKRYVGSAKDFVKRWNGHRAQLKAGRHHNRHLQASWVKHGADSFSFNRLLVCSPENLLMYEQIAIDATAPEFNVERIAGNSLGCIRTPETRAKISAKAKGRKPPPRSAEYRAKISAAHKGKKLPEWHMEALQSGRTKRVYTEEQRQALANAINARYADGTLPREKSQTTREKLSVALTGRPRTDEARANQSAGQLGKKRGPYKPRSAETQAKYAAARVGLKNSMQGRKHSDEARARMSEAQQRNAALRKKAKESL